MPSITELQRLIHTHERRLQKLREQQAFYGPQVNPATLIDIEDTEAELARLSAELAAAKASSPPPAQVGSPAGSILVVEDEKIWQEILQEGLTEAGYQVELATSFSEAKTRLNQTRFDLVTIDARLHDGSNRHDGMLLLDYIHNHFGDSLPVVVISGQIDKRNLVRAFTKFSVANVLLKEDFEYDEFRRVIQAALQSATPKRLG